MNSLLRPNAFYFLLVVFVLFFSMFAFAVNTNTTVMTWTIPSNKSHTLAYGGSCSSAAFHFVETNGEDSDVDGNTSKILPYSAASGGSACQSAAVAGITVTNNGNTSLNLDANFQTALVGNDQNVAIKVWMGTGSGCGSGGLGGWQLPCGIQSTSSPVTATLCRDFNILNFTTAARLVSSLAKNDTNQLCFSGEMHGNDFPLSAGTITRSFDTNSS